MTCRGELFVDGRWQGGEGDSFASSDPATQAPVWRGHAASASQIDAAIAGARRALRAWAGQPVGQRINVLRAFATAVEQRRDELSELISRETGKPLWESRSEVSVMIAKVPRSIEAYERRCDAAAHEVDGARAATVFRPHGVVAVFGPFNLPGHIPNGHIVPALLAGNTVVFKPSDKVAGVGEAMIKCWAQADVPAGVLQLLQGDRNTGQAVAAHPELDGLYFTGSSAAGIAIRRAWAESPQKILALEMGGNNPLIVHDVADLDAAAYLTVQSAYVTAGQRCTCARRLIVPAGNEGDRFVEKLALMMARVRVGLWTDRPEPFMGPVISPTAADALLAAQADLVRRGGRVVVEMRRVGNSATLLSPGLIDVTCVTNRIDGELFGPLLQLIRVPGYDAAITEANRTRYGLAAGLLSDRREHWDRFVQSIRAGVVNWNRQTTNASGTMPFGGVGLSGNHRPSGYFAADYCSYPVATMELDRAMMPARLSPGFA